MVWSSSLTRGVVGVVEGRGHRCWLLSTRDVLTLTRVVEVVVVVCGGAGTGPEGGWQSRMLTRHTSTEHVTYPSPTKTGTGTSRVNFSSPVPVPVTPVPVIPHGFGFPCPSLSAEYYDQMSSTVTASLRRKWSQDIKLAESQRLQ